MKTETAPGTAWEIRVRWGTRRLTAEVLDPRGRRELRLGDTPEDDVAIGTPARLRFTWRDGQLDVQFSAGVVGEAALHGDAKASLSQLALRGAVKESADGFSLTLAGDDTATLSVGTLVVDVRQARSRFPRLPFDARALVFVLLALAAVGLILASVLAPAEGPKLLWLKKR